MERDDKLAEFDQARQSQGAENQKHASLIRTKSAAVKAAAESLKVANAELQQAHRASFAASHSSDIMLTRIERQLLALLPAEASEAAGRLDAAIEAIRGISDPNREDELRLRQLMTLRSEAAESHLLPAGRLKVHVGRINTALARIAELVEV